MEKVKNQNVIKNVQSNISPKRRQKKSYGKSLNLMPLAEKSVSPSAYKTFIINNNTVKVRFSTKSDAPTLEDALVKIAIKKSG